MSLFNFLKKKSSKNDEVYRGPSKEELEAQRKAQAEAQRKARESQRKIQAALNIRNFQKDEAGLYPHEILLLSYYEKYAAGKTIAKFWEYEYAVDDVPALMRSLESRGFADGAKLTDAGREEIAKNEYVMYMHKNKQTDISMARMSILVNQNPGMPFHDILWGEYNRLSMEYAENNRWGYYRNVKYTMYKFLMDEKRYDSAFGFLSEVFFYDMNGSASPFVAPALVEDMRAIERKLDYTDEKIIEILQKRFRGMYAPHRNFTNNEVICVIAAYATGNDGMAVKILAKKNAVR